MNEVMRFTGNNDQLHRGTPGSAGLDIVSDAAVIVQPGSWSWVATGLRVAIPEGHVGLVQARSGLAGRTGYVIGAGVIDSDYRGEVNVLVINPTDYTIEIDKGARIAQLLVLPIAPVTPVQVEALDDTERSAKGFGSTGK